MHHTEFLKVVSTRPVEYLRNEVKNIIENKEAVAHASEFAYVSDLREEKLKLFGQNRKVHRVFATADDTGFYLNIGWVLCDDIDHCMACMRKFGMFFDPREHCRACGNVICNKCSENLALVEELRRCDLVPVCPNCDWGQVSSLSLYLCCRYNCGLRLSV